MRVVAIAAPDFAPLPVLRAAVPEVFVSADLAELRDAARDAEVIVVAPREGALLREVWPHAERVKWVHTLAAGVESLLFPELNVTLTNSRGIFADALAEFAIAAMLFFAKDLRRVVRNQDARQWAPFTVSRLEETTVGIIGFGSIGRAVARQAEAFGMDVCATRTTPIDELLSVSDYVVISAPLTRETRGMIGARELALMQPHAYLINIARGELVDEAALYDALANGRIAGAALDVFEHEPLYDSPLFGLENVLISPHSADHTSDSHDRTMQFFLENLARFDAGKQLRNVVGKIRGY